MMTSAQTSAAAFNNAVDFFFGHNPANPYWALVAMYLRKENALAIVENYEGDENNIIAPQSNGIDIHIESNTFETYEMPEGVITLSIIGNISDRPQLREIMQMFDDASSENISAADKSIFARRQWDPRFLLAFADSILKLDDDWFQKNYSDLFDKVVRRIFANDRFDIYTQPKEVSQVVGHLMGMDYHCVYNPFCGISSYANTMNGDARYIGEEKVGAIAGVAKLRLLSSDIDGDVRHYDSINDSTYGADLIVSTPPFGLMVKDTIYANREDVDTFLLRKIASHSCRGIVVVPAGINFRAGYVKRLREYLVENDCVDMVISLPERIFEGTGISTSIYVLDPNHSHKGSIKFVDASHLYLTDNKRRILDVLSTLSAIRIPGSKSKLVSLDEIKSNDFNFNPSSYMDVAIEVPQGATLMHIYELCTTYERTSVSKNPASGKVINLSWQQNINKAKIYTPIDFAIENLSPRNIAITSSVLIIPMGGPIRGIVVDNEGETLYSNRDSLHLIVNDSIILPQYLAIQFGEEYVTNQIGVGFLGRVPFEIVNRLQIIVPPLDVQREAIDKYQAALVNKLGIEVDQLKTQQANEFERNMHLRKHALKQVLNEVVPASRRIARFISSQIGDFDKDVIIAERSHSTLEDYSQRLYRNVEKIQRLITALTDEEIFPEAETFDFLEFMTSYKLRKFTDDRYTMFILGESHFLDNEPEIPNDIAPGEKIYISSPELTAHIAPSAMETVLDNLIANAINHGFIDNERKDYGVKVIFHNTMSENRMMLEIKVMNNGAKLPVGMSPDKVFSWGVGNGTGLGSWQTKNIIEHYGGSVEFIQYDDAPDGYNIEYKMLIPMS